MRDHGLLRSSCSRGTSRRFLSVRDHRGWKNFGTWFCELSSARVDIRERAVVGVPVDRVHISFDPIVFLLNVLSFVGVAGLLLFRSQSDSGC
jgi:hypothetical protein